MEVAERNHWVPLLPSVPDEAVIARHATLATKHTRDTAAAGRGNQSGRAHVRCTHLPQPI